MRGGRARGVGLPEEAAPDSRICVLGTFFRFRFSSFGFGLRILSHGSWVSGFGIRDSGFGLRVWGGGERHLVWVDWGQVPKQL